MRHTSPSLPLAALLLALASSPALAYDPPPAPGTYAPTPKVAVAAEALTLSLPEDGDVLIQPPERIELHFSPGPFDLDPASLELWLDGVEYSESLEFWLDTATLSEAASIVQASGQHTVYARIRDNGGSYFEINASFELLAVPCPGGCPWPISPTSEPDVIANSMEDFQSFGTPHYWHKGLDIRAPAGTAVYSPVDGNVVQVVNYSSGSLYWEVAVQDATGLVWQFNHLSAGSIAVSQGQPVDQGDLLGNIVSWPSSMNGYRYHHTHLNVARWTLGGPVPGPYIDGWIYYNPLLFLTDGSYVENVPPTQFTVYFAQNESNTAFAASSDASTPTLSGDIDVIARLRDRRATIPPANGQPFDIGIYDLSMSIAPIDTPCMVGYRPRTWLGKFDKVPGGILVADQLDTLQEVFKDSFQYGGSLGSDFTYSTQVLYYTLTNTHLGQPDGPDGYWATDLVNGFSGAVYPDGSYSLLIHAQDFDGNLIETSTTVELSNGIGYEGFCPNVAPFAGPIWREPIELASSLGESAYASPAALPLAFGPVEEGVATAVVGAADWPAWVFDFPANDLRVAVGLLAGQSAVIEFHPTLGDVIIRADAEAQLLPGGAGGGDSFDPAAMSSTPVSLRLSTRLARDPSNGDALIGSRMTQELSFRLALAAEFDLAADHFVLRSDSEGALVSWQSGAPIPAMARPFLVLLCGFLLGAGAWMSRRRS